MLIRYVREMVILSFIVLIGDYRLFEVVVGIGLGIELFIEVWVGVGLGLNDIFVIFCLIIFVIIK